MKSRLRYAWVMNLDAELEMARASSYQAPARVIKQQETYGAAALDLLARGDRLLSDLSPDEADDFLGRAWCVTSAALARMREAGVTPEAHPDPAVVKRVNHRLFAHQLGGGLPGQRYVTTRKELDQVLREGAPPWLLKRPLAFAGRGQIRIQGALDDRIENWIAASLAKDGVIVEPLVKPTQEFSLHGYVDANGQARIGNVCVQKVSGRGVYQGARLATDEDITTNERSALHERATAVANALMDAGYFGPFGIDGYRYQAAGKTAFCALGEINARYTMSFAIGFGRDAV